MRYEHWRLVPETSYAWPWLWFTPKELADRRTGELLINSEFASALDMVRSLYGHSLHVSSCFRSAYTNALAGGAPRSMHLFALAADISIIDRDKHLLKELAQRQGFTGFGHYRTFLHIDMRARPTEWGKWDA